MNSKDIKQLLDAFYNGLTSPEEEKELKEFFLNGNLPEEWLAEKVIFERYLNITEIPLPDGLEERLTEKLSAHIFKSKSSSMRIYLSRVASLATVALVCIGIFIGYQQKREPMLTDTFQDPMEAALVAEEALLFLSEQLNTGLAQMKEAQQEINKINHIVHKQLND
ncbi:MAG: hypothetical protein LUE98_20085 [Tannerellaceae bacterium]|nr:hypothetical protein [Tannerellaceae bacterium]